MQLKRFLLAFVGLWLVWLMLVGTVAMERAVLGAVVAALAALIALPRLALLDGVRMSLALPWHVLRFLAVFLRALLAANIDMARRVLSPSLPIQPAIVEVATQLQSPLARLLLANAVTLTPGTLSVDVLDDYLQVHWIDTTPGVDLEHATAEIIGRFEGPLSGFLR